MKYNLYSFRNPINSLLTIWIIYLAILAGLQLMGLSFGFRVFALGEDRNWISLIMDSTGTKLAHKYWNILDRNPLSPWIWWIVAPLIKMSDWSLYLIRKCMDPILAVMTFLLIDKLGKQQCRTFAFSVAIFVMLWNFSAYYEHFMWCFHVALALNLLAIFLYCRYLDNKRKSATDLVIALICYLVAIAVYTLHSGTVIAIAALAFFRNQSASPVSFKKRLHNTLRDAGFFLALFVIYDCLWITTSTNFKVFYRFNWKIFFNQFADSVHGFIFTDFYRRLWQATLNDFSMLTIASIFALSFLAFYLTLSLLTRKQILDKAIKVPYLWVGVILLTIAFPLAMVESTSSIWGPGSRSIMVYQVWQPLFYVTIIFALANLLPFSPQLKRNSAIIALAILGSLTVLGGLDYNHRLVIRTHYQEILAQGLKNIPIPAGVAPHFLVKLKNPEDTDINTIIPVLFKYGQTLMHDDKISIRMLTHIPNPVQKELWVVRFKSDNEGVINAGEFTVPKPVPYKNLWIVNFDGKNVTLPSSIDKKDLEGLQISWERNGPINQAKLHG